MIKKLKPTVNRIITMWKNCLNKLILNKCMHDYYKKKIYECRNNMGKFIQV